MPTAEEVARGACRYCKRSLLKHQLPDPPVQVFLSPQPVAHHPVAQDPSLMVWVVLGAVVAMGMMGAMVGLSSASTLDREPPSFSNPSKPEKKPLVTLPEQAPSPAPLTEPAPAPLATAAPAPSHSTRTTHTASSPAPTKVTVAVAVHRYDSERVSAAALNAFVSPARRCFTAKGQRVRVQLQFSAQGALQSAQSQSGSADTASSCAIAALNALSGQSPTGYVAGAASSAVVELGS